MKSNFLVISGGLGNQLFQFAGAKSDCGDRGLIIESALCNPKSPTKREQLSRFDLDTSTAVVNSRYKAKLIKYPYNLLLRLSVKRGQSLTTKLMRSTASFLGSMVFSLCYLKFIRVVLGNGLGFTNFPESRFSKLYVGYFQAAEYANIIGDDRLKVLLRLKNHTLTKKHEFNDYRKGVLTIHLRLGDYLYEDQLGVLGYEYYSRGLRMIVANAEINRIKVFSNDLDSARQILSDNFWAQVDWMENVGNDAVDLLEEMKQAENFLIANSTLSWWAARLGASEKSLVVYPDPWFQQKSTPIGLFPVSWKGIKPSWLDPGEKRKLSVGGYL